MPNVVIGTAGHVDHGKTTLVRALTGIETDTTKEEKKRGLSINLGFAYFDLPDGQRVGIVDVPGHEKFIKNMVAGLPGINIVLLVIDAGESIMPQTKEHVEILTLLGIKDFIIVLSKVDTVDADTLELTKEDVREQFLNTVLVNSPLVETDAVTGRGMKKLIAVLQSKVENIQMDDVAGSARLNVDRAFSVQGFGTVVTGTLLDGPMSIGNELTLYSSQTLGQASVQKKVRIRNIQIHEQNVERATPRQRTALNLTGVTKDAIQRGDVLSISDQLKATWMLDVKVKCLERPKIEIRLWDRLRLLIGTREVLARAVPIGVDSIEPGEEGFLNLRLEEQIFVEEKDRFILRSYSPMVTIAGGEVLDTAATKHKRYKASVIENLKIKESGNQKEIIAQFLIQQNPNHFVYSLKELSEGTKIPVSFVQEKIKELKDEQQIFEVKSGFIHEQRLQNAEEEIRALLKKYHQQFPLRYGMAPEEYRSRLRKIIPDKEIPVITALLLNRGVINSSKGKFADKDFKVSFTEKQKYLKDKIETLLRQSGYTPVKSEDILKIGPDAQEVLNALIDDSAVPLTFEYFISKETEEKAIQKIKDYIHENKKMTLGDFRDITDSSRKSSMLILEYMDSKGITERVENYRILGHKA